MRRPKVAASIVLSIVTGIKGITQETRAAEKDTLLTRQNNIAPHNRLTTLPNIRDNEKTPLKRVRYSVPRPISQVISGKDNRKPPVGPVRHCRPPVKLENTGTPMLPIKIYTRVDRVPLREPNRIPDSVTAKDCMVIGTPTGIGMDIWAMIARMAVVTAMKHKDCILECFGVIKSPKIVNAYFVRG